MLIVGALLAVALPMLARRRARIPTGGANFLEVVVIFVRDMIARPALHEKAYTYLSYLCTLFVFILGLNMFGIVPLDSITGYIGQFVSVPTIGGTATATLTVTAALAGTSLLATLVAGMGHQAKLARERRRWPAALAVPAAPVLWLVSLSPPLPGLIGKVLLLPMIFLELVGVAAKCFSLMVRLCANMMAGHILLAVLMSFILQTAGERLSDATVHAAYVAPICILGSVLVMVLELLVAFLQAYIFTFITAMLFGLYVAPEH
jgi:F-type H+-transporting ATPase subunit a